MRIDETVYDEVAEFVGYLRYVRIEDGEVRFTLHSSDSAVLDLVKRSLEEEIECEHDDPAIWFKFRALRRAP